MEAKNMLLFLSHPFASGPAPAPWHTALPTAKDGLLPLPCVLAEGLRGLCEGRRGNTDVAAASVLAGVAAALVGLDLAAAPGKARPAGAGEAPLARVGAGGPILAGMVVGAVVEVLVAEEPAPAFLAVALPGLHTRAVEAAWVTHALLAQGPLPADPALALPRLLTEAVAGAAAGQTDR